jgi:hypothetical protein
MKSNPDVTDLPPPQHYAEDWAPAQARKMIGRGLSASILQSELS